MVCNILLCIDLESEVITIFKQPFNPLQLHASNTWNYDNMMQKPCRSFVVLPIVTTSKVHSSLTHISGLFLAFLLMAKSNLLVFVKGKRIFHALSFEKKGLGKSYWLQFSRDPRSCKVISAWPTACITGCSISIW